MLNQDGITKKQYGKPVQILANVEHQYSVGCRVPQSLGTLLSDGTKIAKAGTPIIINFNNLQADVSAASGPVAGVFTVQITAPFAKGESLVIEGKVYTCAENEDISGKKFAGATAEEQVASLLKMVKCTDYVVAAVSGATDKIGFTQSGADVSDTTGPDITTTATTGTIGTVTQVTAPSVSTTGNAVLLHNVDVTRGSSNGTALVWGFVNINRLDDEVKAKVAAGTKVGDVQFLNI